MFKRSLGQLKADIMRANGAVQEANFLAEEMEKQTKFSVTLQIPPANLSPNRRVSFGFWDHIAKDEFLKFNSFCNFSVVHLLVNQLYWCVV